MRAIRHVLILTAIAASAWALADAATVGRSRVVNCMIPAAADLGDGGGTIITGTVCGTGYSSVVVQNNHATAHVYVGFPEGDGGRGMAASGFTTRNYATAGLKYGPTAGAGVSFSANVLQNKLSCIGQPGAGQDASVPVAVMCLK